MFFLLINFLILYLIKYSIGMNDKYNLDEHRHRRRDHQMHQTGQAVQSSSSSSSSDYKYAAEYGQYDPVMAGSIDGTDDRAHDRAVLRALAVSYTPNKAVRGDSERTIFVGRLSYETSEADVRHLFDRYGTLRNVRLVRDIVTGFSRGYAFVEFKHRSDAHKAHKETRYARLNGREIIVEFEHERALAGWVPRRLGGGLGGYKQSGQLRFGGRYKPWISAPTASHSQLQRTIRK
jgi:hypothetical protein